MIIRVFVVICLNFRKISCLFIVVNRQEWLDINRHKHWPLHPIIFEDKNINRDFEKVWFFLIVVYQGPILSGDIEGMVSFPPWHLQLSISWPNFYNRRKESYVYRFVIMTTTFVRPTLLRIPFCSSLVVHSDLGPQYNKTKMRNRNKGYAKFVITHIT